MPEEFDVIRAEAKLAAVQAIGDGLDFYISKTYGFTDEKTQDMLNHFACHRDTLRGLERFVSQEYAEGRGHLRHKHFKAVMYTQRRLDKEREKVYDKRAIVISNVALTVSREAAEFAFMMGSADQKAAFAHHSMMDRRLSNSSTHSAMRRSSISSTKSATRRSSTQTDPKRAPRRASLSAFITQNKATEDMDRSDRSTVSVGVPNKQPSPPRKIEVRTTQAYGRKDITVVDRLVR